MHTIKGFNIYAQYFASHEVTCSCKCSKESKLRIFARNPIPNTFSLYTVFLLKMFARGKSVEMCSFSSSNFFNTLYFGLCTYIFLCRIRMLKYVVVGFWSWERERKLLESEEIDKETLSFQYSQRAHFLCSQNPYFLAILLYYYNVCTNCW